MKFTFGQRVLDLERPRARGRAGGADGRPPVRVVPDDAAGLKVGPVRPAALEAVGLLPVREARLRHARLRPPRDRAMPSEMARPAFEVL